MYHDPRYEHVPLPEAAQHSVAHHASAEFTKELHHIHDHHRHHGMGAGHDHHISGHHSHTYGDAHGHGHAHDHLPHLSLSDGRHEHSTVQPGGREKPHSYKSDVEADSRLPEAVRKDIVAEHHHSQEHGHERGSFNNTSEARAHAHLPAYEHVPGHPHNHHHAHSRYGHFVLPHEYHGQGHHQSHRDGGGEQPYHAGDRPHVTNGESPSKTGFGQKLLERLGLPVSEKNLAFLDAWQRAEGGSADNPFNTTQPMPGSHRYNGVGVQRYNSMEQGLDATVKTLESGYYGGILRALKSENITAAAEELRTGPWGTKNIRNFV